MPLRSSFSKSRNGTKHPYYLCQTKTCEAYGKSIRRDDLERDVGELIRQLEPAQGLTKLIRAMFRKAWDIRAEQAQEAAGVMRQKISGLEREITKTVDRIVNTDSEAVIKALETKVDNLEKQKLLLTDKASSQAKPAKTFEEQLEPVVAFLTNPWKLWDTGEINLRRLVLKLAFADPIKYCRNRGARTTKISLPFRALGGFSTDQVSYGGA